MQGQKSKEHYILSKNIYWFCLPSSLILLLNGKHIHVKSVPKKTFSVSFQTALKPCSRTFWNSFELFLIVFFLPHFLGIAYSKDIYRVLHGRPWYSWAIPGKMPRFWRDLCKNDCGAAVLASCPFSSSFSTVYLILLLPKCTLLLLWDNIWMKTLKYCEIPSFQVKI